MLKSIVSDAKAFIDKYLIDGPDVLINCEEHSEYKSITENLNALEISDIGLRNSDLTDQFKAQRISYINIIENDNLCIGIFCLPKGKQLSLHDHPNMMVLSKLLCGKISRRAMDLKERSQQFSLAERMYIKNEFEVIGSILEATLYSEKTFETNEIMRLTPESGNIHSFEALEDTAILDILLPNYNNQDRFCNFYYEISEESISPESDMEEEIKLIEFTKASGDKTTKTAPSRDNDPDSKEIKLVYAFPPQDLDIFLVEYKGDLVL